jgi:hypothetical protein
MLAMVAYSKYRPTHILNSKSMWYLPERPKRHAIVIMKL